MEVPYSATLSKDRICKAFSVFLENLGMKFCFFACVLVLFFLLFIWLWISKCLSGYFNFKSFSDKHFFHSQ